MTEAEKAGTYSAREGMGMKPSPIGTEKEVEALLDDLFDYHDATPDQIFAMNTVRNAAKATCRAILNECPSSPDRSDAIRKLREASQMACASIMVRCGGALPR